MKAFTQGSLWLRMNPVGPVVSEKKNFESLLYVYIVNFDLGL
jgi:hypothetical protein